MEKTKITANGLNPFEIRAGLEQGVSKWTNTNGKVLIPLKSGLGWNKEKQNERLYRLRLNPFEIRAGLELINEHLVEQQVGS